MEKIKVFNYKRTEADAEFLKSIVEKYGLKIYNGNLDIEVNEEQKKEIEKEIKIYCEELKVTKKQMQTKVIKRNMEKEEELLEKIKKFDDAVKEVKHNPFVEYTVESIKQYDDIVKEIIGLEIIIENSKMRIYDARMEMIKSMEQKEEIKEYLKYLQETEEIKEEIKNEIKEGKNFGKYRCGNTIVNKIKTERLGRKYTSRLEELTGLGKEEIKKIQNNCKEEITMVKVGMRED